MQSPIANMSPSFPPNVEVLACNLPHKATVQEFSQWVFAKTELYMYAPRRLSTGRLYFSIDARYALSIERWQSVTKSFSRHLKMAPPDHLKIGKIHCPRKIVSEPLTGCVILVTCLCADRVLQFSSNASACHWMLKSLHSLLIIDLFREIRGCQFIAKNFQKNACVQFLLELQSQQSVYLVVKAIDDKRLPNAEVVLVANQARCPGILDKDRKNIWRYLEELKQITPPPSPTTSSREPRKFSESFTSSLMLQTISSVESLPSLVDSLGPPPLIEDVEGGDTPSETM